MTTSELSPQPLPPRHSPNLNPQPLPPHELAVRLEDFTENMTTAVLRALASHQKDNPDAAFRAPRIICGIILEPSLLAAGELGGGTGVIG